jgi:serine/threonine-protein phosphatase 6 catalytic subunit
MNNLELIARAHQLVEEGYQYKFNDKYVSSQCAYQISPSFILVVFFFGRSALIYPAVSRLVTVWSAPNYCYRCGNEAAILKLCENGKREVTVYGPAAENDTDSKMRERRQVCALLSCNTLVLIVYFYLLLDYDSMVTT